MKEYTEEPQFSVPVSDDDMAILKDIAIPQHARAGQVLKTVTIERVLSWCIWEAWKAYCAKDGRDPSLLPIVAPRKSPEWTPEDREICDAHVKSILAMLNEGGSQS